jgi:ribosomal protein S18 acetylase RimI-like enzyme
MLRIMHTVRLATPEDYPRIRALAGDQEVSRATGHRFVLVLDDGAGGLAAAAAVTLDKGRGHLGFLAIAPGFEGERLEDRMIGIAEAMCEAFGCATLDVPRRRAA